MTNYREIIEADEYFLKPGYGIYTEFINILPTVGDVFKDKNDSYDPSKHIIRFKTKLGKFYNQTSSNVSTEKVAASDTGPFPEDLEDINSGETNGTITRGGTTVMEGARLKNDIDDPTHGIFLFAINGTGTRANKIFILRTAQIVFVIPATLAPGNFTFEVRANPNKSKSVKKGFLAEKLTVS